MSRRCLRLQAAPENLEPLLGFVEQNALRAGLDEGQVKRVELALEEVTVNIIRHAYGGEGGELELCCTPVAGGLEIRIVDQGPPFNPLEAPGADLAGDVASRRIGGLGIHLVRNVASGLRYRREGKRNVLTLSFPRHREAEP